MLTRHDRGDGARLEGAREMVVAIVGVALDGDEEVARFKRPAVDRHAANDGAQRRAWSGADSGGELAFAPEPGHAASFNAARASSASEKGSVIAPTIWPVSWPLPAMTNASPS